MKLRVVPLLIHKVTLKSVLFNLSIDRPRIVLAGLLLLTSQPASAQERWEPSALQRFWSLKVNPMEFRQPIRFVPFDLKFGTMIYGGPDSFGAFPASLFRSDNSFAVLDSTETSISSIREVANRIALTYEVQLLKSNFLNRFWRQNYLDIHTGIGFRYNRGLSPVNLPANWPQGKSQYKLLPSFYEANLNLAFVYQRSERWLGYTEVAAGWSAGHLYRASFLDRYLTGNGFSMNYAAGVKLLGEAEGQSRYGVGLELRYHVLDIPELSDPDNISPILEVKERAFGLFVSLSTLFGARKTSADRAKQEMYAGDFIAAESGFTDYLSKYGYSFKARKAEKLLALCREMIPYQQYDMGLSAHENGDFDRAMEFYSKALLKAEEPLKSEIIGKQEEIGLVYLQQADELVSQGQLVAGENLLGRTNRLLPAEGALVGQYRAEILIKSAQLYVADGLYDSALKIYDRALAADPTREVEINGYKAQLIDGLLKDAEKAADASALTLVLETLRLSRTLDPRKEAELTALIERLELQQKAARDADIHQRIDSSLQETREKRNPPPSGKPAVGMLVAKVMDLLGKPSHVSEETDRFGVNHQLWEYTGGPHPGLYYFENHVLVKVEER